MAASVPFTGSPLAGGNDVPSPRHGVIGRRLEFLRHLHRAVGPTGLAWATAAALLGMLSLVIALFHGQVTRDMTGMRGNQAMAGVISASDHLGNALTALLGANAGGSSYTRLHPPLFEW